MILLEYPDSRTEPFNDYVTDTLREMLDPIIETKNVILIIINLMK